MTPEEAANSIHNNPSISIPAVEHFILNATARELQTFMHRLNVTSSQSAAVWLDRAKIALSIRLAEDEAKTADTLITESKKLGRLNWALIFLTAGLLILTAGLLYIDSHREHEPTTTIQSTK